MKSAEFAKPWYSIMGYPLNTQERRITQRRKNRTGIKFPLTDSRGCIVLFDRSYIADRRIKRIPDWGVAKKGESGIPPTGSIRTEEMTGQTSSPLVSGGERDFSIAGELIAKVDNLYTSQSAGKWKVLELYRTPKGRYICVEIWCTAMAGKNEQYWLTTCDDLKSAYEFFGRTRLANELFENVLCK